MSGKQNAGTVRRAKKTPPVRKSKPASVAPLAPIGRETRLHVIPPNSAVYTIKDICVLIQKSRAWVFEARKRGDIPMSKFMGGEAVWSRKSFDAWLDGYLNGTGARS